MVTQSDLIEDTLMTINLVSIHYLLKQEYLNLIVIRYKLIRIYSLNIVKSKVGGTLPCTLVFICILPTRYLVIKLKKNSVLDRKADYVFKWRSQLNCFSQDI